MTNRLEKTVVVVGWDKSLNNMGDMILMDSACWLVDNSGGGYITRRMDFSPSKWSVPFKLFNKIFTPLLKLSEKFGFDNSVFGKIHYRLKAIWYSILLDSYYARNLCGCDAVITAGGAAFKCQTQDQSFYLERLAKVAKNKNLPVMINAGAIEEELFENDIRFIRLFQRLSNSTIKCITTRNDDIALIEEHIPIHNLTFGAVADTAYWIPETYGVTKNLNSNTIGINLVRENICLDYKSMNLSNEGLFQLYEAVITELDKRGYHWRLFTNGIPQDLEFGKKLCKKIGLDWHEVILPTAKCTREYVKQVSNLRAVISGRMHSAITAYALDIPVAAFVWSPKMRLFADSAGIGEFFLDEGRISGQALVDALEKAINYPVSMGENQKRKKNLTKFYIEDFLSKNI